MEIFRTFVALLCLCLFQSMLSETQGICKGNLPQVQHVTLNSNVTVPCPVLRAPEMDFKLYKGSNEVISIYVRTTNTYIRKKESQKSDLPAELNVNLDNSTSFILVGVTMNITDLYTCEATINYPPPLMKVEHTPQTIVFVEDSPIKRHVVCQDGNHLVLWVVLGATAVYGLVMTLVVFILRNKLNQSDTPFKDRCRRKWQGVQHPTWQGFYIDTVV